MKAFEMAVGERLILGQWRMSEIDFASPLIWEKASFHNDFYSTTSIGHFCADAKEPASMNRGRRERGSNFFPRTNIAQFLNSPEQEWFKPQTETDVVDERLSRRPGFLHLFQDWELNVIVPQTITTVVPEGFRRDYGTHFTETVRVSLLSQSQIREGCDTFEGEQLEYFDIYPFAARNILTRTAIGSGLVAMDRDGKIRSHSPADTARICPLIRIDGACPIEYDTESGCYYILPPDDVIQHFTDELHLILK